MSSKIIGEIIGTAIGLGICFLLSALGISDFIIFVIFASIGLIWFNYRINRLEDK